MEFLCCRHKLGYKLKLSLVIICGFVYKSDGPVPVTDVNKIYRQKLGEDVLVKRA